MWIGVCFWWLMMPQRIGDYSALTSVGILNTQYLSFYSYLFCASSRCQCRHSISLVLNQSPLLTANSEQSKWRKWFYKILNFDIFMSPEIPVNGGNFLLTDPKWDNTILFEKGFCAGLVAPSIPNDILVSIGCSLYIFLTSPLMHP